MHDLSIAEHQHLFQDYVIAGLRHCTALAGAPAAVGVPDDLRAQSWHLLSYGLRLPAAWPAARDLVLALAPHLELTPAREAWLPYLQQAAAAATEYADPAAGELHRHLGVLLRALGRLAAAEASLTAALAASTAGAATTGDPRGRARAHNELAFLAVLRHDPAAAQTHLDQAGALLPADDPERAMTLSLLGILAAERRAWDEAEAWLRQALALRAREGNLRKTASNLLNLAFCLERQGRPAEARAAYERTVALLEDVPDATLQIGARLNLGIFLDNGGDPAAALAHYAHAETLALQAADPLHLARVHNNRAHALLHLGQPAAAAAACRQSAEHYARLGDDAARLDVLDTLAQVHRAAGEPAAARAVLASALAEAAPRRAEPAFARLHDLLAGHLAELDASAAPPPIASGVSTGG